MKLYKRHLYTNILAILVLFLSFAPDAGATVGISGSFYNSENAFDIYEIGVDVDFGGTVTLLPYAGFSEYPFSIYSDGYGHPNKSPEETRMAFKLDARGNDKAVSARSGLQADPSVKAVVSSKWGHSLSLGNIEGEDCTLDQFTSMRSEPGYLTFPSVRSMESITAGMTFDAFDDKRNELLEKKYIPMPEYGEYPLTLSVMKGVYNNVYMTHDLKMSASW